MKKVLSITLTLAMLLGSFLMLVPTVSATEGAGSEPAPAPAGGIYYANDFDDVTATDTAGILASIGWKLEEGKNVDFGSDSTLAVEDGRLVIYAGQGADQNSENFIVIENNEALKNGYVVDYDLEMLAKDEGTGVDSAFSVHSSVCPLVEKEGKMVKNWAARSGRHGWISQIRWNTNVLSGCEDGTGWKPAVNNTPAAATNTYLKQTVVDATTGEESTTVATSMQNIRVSVRVAFDATAKTIKTYVKAYEPNAVFTEDDLMQTATPNTDAGLALLTESLRFLVYKGIKVAIDNVMVGTADAIANVVSRETLYENNFDTATGANTTEVLTAIGWATEQEWAAESESSAAIEEGRLILDAVTDQEEFVVLKDKEALLDGYVVEFDIELLANDRAGADFAKKDNAFSVHSSLGDFSARAGRQGWIGQIRWNTNILAGSEDGNGWDKSGQKLSNGTPANAKETYLKKDDGTTASTLQNIRINVRLEYDPTTSTVKNYTKTYTGGDVVWTGSDLSQVADKCCPGFFTDDLRIIVYKGMKVALDNVKVFKDGPISVTVNGEADGIRPGALDLAELTDGTFAFAVINGSQVVTETGYSMDKYVTSIDVYSLEISALKGASIRTTGGAALRFRTAVSKADIEGLDDALESGAVKNIEFGTLTIDYATLGALGQLKLDTEGATKVAITDADVADYGTDDYALSCVIEVAADKLNTKYAAAGYVIVEFNDGSKLELTAKYDKYTMVRSVAEIAQTITFDEAHGLSAAQLQVVNTYAAAYVAE